MKLVDCWLMMELENLPTRFEYYEILIYTKYISGCQDVKVLNHQELGLSGFQFKDFETSALRLNHQQLVTEVLTQLAFFKPNPKLVKQS